MLPSLQQRQALQGFHGTLAARRWGDRAGRVAPGWIVHGRMSSRTLVAARQARPIQRADVLADDSANWTVECVVGGGLVAQAILEDPIHLIRLGAGTKRDIEPIRDPFNYAAPVVEQVDETDVGDIRMRIGKRPATGSAPR
jgi:hypothetical protein